MISITMLNTLKQMLTEEEVKQAAEDYIQRVCSPIEIQAVKDYAKSDFAAGAQYALDKCLTDYNELIEVISNLISLEELEERAREKGVKIKLFK